MPDEPTRGMARIEKREISDVPPSWTEQKRGQHFWRLLLDKGINPSRFYTVEYFPLRHCWLLVQDHYAGQDAGCAEGPPSDLACESFYVRAIAELRRTARAAFAAVAARSSHFARFGCKYELPPKPQEVTPADLMKQLGGRAADRAAVHFNSEGGWRIEPVQDRD